MINIFCIQESDSLSTIRTFCFKNLSIKQLEFIDTYNEQEAWEQLLRKRGDQNGWKLQKLKSKPLKKSI